VKRGFVNGYDAFAPGITNNLIRSSESEAGLEGLTPIVVLGAGHSGTTIIYQMLAMHPDVTWFSQISQRDGTIPGRTAIPFHTHIDRMLRRLYRHDWRKDKRYRSGLGALPRALMPRPMEAHKIWNYLIPSGGSVPPQECASRIRRVFEEEYAFSQKDYLVTKPLWLYRELDVLVDVYSTTKFVHVVRDGRAVALSLQSKYQETGALDRQSLLDAAQHWGDVVYHLTIHSLRTSMATVRYEDFCTDVHGSLIDLLSSLGLDSSTFPLKRCPTSLKSTNPRWLSQLVPWKEEVLFSVQKEGLERYGYL
jgi:hypothetical protein